MRAIRDHEDLRATHRAGAGFIHNLEGQVLHAAACEHVASMGPGRKLLFASLAEAERELASDARRRWSACPACLPALAPARPVPSGAAARARAPAKAPPSPTARRLEVSAL